jgi:hypothetical protein
MDIATLGVLVSIITVVGGFLWGLHKILSVVKQTALSNEKLELRVSKIEDKIDSKIDKLTENINDVNSNVGKLEGIITVMIERERN